MNSSDCCGQEKHTHPAGPVVTMTTVLFTRLPTHKGVATMKTSEA